MIGTILNGFTITKILNNKGGMSKLYLAENRIGKKLAVKVLLPEYFNNKELRYRFINEAKILVKLEHEHICQVIDLVEKDTYVAMLLEYLEGYDLSSKIGKTSETEMKLWLPDICSALQYAHENQIYHRDIKPSNIYLHKGKIKILDFGIAKMKSSSTITRTNTMMGTIAYMSPEQIKSTKDIDHKTDIFSLGVTIHHILSGEFPFGIEDDDSQYTMFQKVINNKLSIIPNVSEEINIIIQKAIQKDKNYRFENIEDLFKVININSKVIEDFGIEMVYVEGGTFIMGCTEEQGSDCEEDEKPAHSVTLSSFSIGKYPVTQAQWKSIMDNKNPSYFKNCDDCPVDSVSWDDIQIFLQKLNAKTGKNYRLPTEAEWEFASRGGNKSKGYKYSGSNDVNEVAWYYKNSGDETHKVGEKAPNELGIYDMSGNVWEWCYDWYGDYSSISQTNPTGPSTGTSRVLRGGSWYNVAVDKRVSYRISSTPSTRHISDGFRLVLP